MTVCAETSEEAKKEDRHIAAAARRDRDEGAMVKGLSRSGPSQQ